MNNLYAVLLSKVGPFQMSIIIIALLVQIAIVVFLVLWIIKRIKRKNQNHTGIKTGD
jgi:hypothetical protein